MLKLLLFTAKTEN